MWISKKEWKVLNKKIAALEEEQLEIRKAVSNNIQSDNELIKIVKRLRDDLFLLKSINANINE